MNVSVWLGRGHCLALHDMMLAQFGGLAGLRDSGLLESAIAKPRHLMTYGSPTLPELAASYAAGIIRNHPFLDGNKRTGFLVAVTFLERNGCEFSATEESVVERTLAFAAGEITERDYAKWLAAHSGTSR